MEEALQALMTALAAADDSTRSACELADAAVLLGHAAQPLARPELAARSLELAAAAVDRADGHAGLGLYDGLVGVAWSVEHLFAHPPPWPVDERSEPRWTWDDDPVEDVHDVLLFETVRPASTHPAELSYGRVGHGVLELERTILARRDSRRMLAAIVDRLDGAAVTTARGVTWRAAADDADDYDDLGLAHGSAGVVVFLARVVHAGIALHRAVPLLERAVAWLLDQQLPDGGFPGRVHPGASPEPCRLAWCYGDLGVALALWNAGASLRRPELRELALDLALRSATRDAASAGVEGVAFCHGAAGLAHLFHVLHHATGAEPLRAAACRWLDQTVQFALPDPGEAPWSMLEGLAGIGLVWVASISSRPPSWGSRFSSWPVLEPTLPTVR